MKSRPLLLLIILLLITCVLERVSSFDWPSRDKNVMVICKLSQRPFSQENYDRMNKALDQVLRSNDMKLEFQKTLDLNFPLAITYTFDDMSQAVMAKNLFLDLNGIEEILLKKNYASGEGELEMFPGKDYDENVDKSGDPDFSNDRLIVDCQNGKPGECVLKREPLKP